MAIAPWVVSDRFWERIASLLPKRQRCIRYPGRKPLPDRKALQGILFVLHTGIAWRHLPLELGFGSRSTCYRRMFAWQQAGVGERLHTLLLAELRAAGELEWSRAVADGQQRSAVGTGELYRQPLTGGATVLPKLGVRVRFPSPAPPSTPGHEPASARGYLPAEQAEPLGVVNRLTAGRGPELSVDRYRLGLDGVG
jgi:transposase